MTFKNLNLEQAKLPGYSYSDLAGSILCHNRYLIKGVLNEGDVAIMFGESGCMKSFVATDIAFHLATDTKWRGHRVKGGRIGVMIILGEGAAGYAKRIKALQTHYAENEAPIWIVTEPVSLLTDVKQLRNWINRAEHEMGIKIEVLIMDTLSLMLGDGDESSNSDISKALNNVRKAADGRSVILIHHTGHTNSERERGAYQIRGNADVRILVKLDPISEVISLNCLKSKDEKPFEPIHIGYKEVEIAADEDGDPVTSLVLVETDKTPSPANKKKPKALAIMEQAISECGLTDTLALKKRFNELYTGSPDTLRRAYSDGWNAYCDITNGHLNS